MNTNVPINKSRWNIRTKKYPCHPLIRYEDEFFTRRWRHVLSLKWPILFLSIVVLFYKIILHVYDWWYNHSYLISVHVSSVLSIKWDTCRASPVHQNSRQGPNHYKKCKLSRPGLATGKSGNAVNVISTTCTLWLYGTSQSYLMKQKYDHSQYLY